MNHTKELFAKDKELLNDWSIQPKRPHLIETEFFGSVKESWMKLKWKAKVRWFRYINAHRMIYAYKQRMCRRHSTRMGTIYHAQAHNKKQKKNRCDLG